MEDEYYAKDGLLWRRRDNTIVELPEADRVAREHGYLYVERMVKALGKKAHAKAEGDRS